MQLYYSIGLVAAIICKAVFCQAEIVGSATSINIIESIESTTRKTQTAQVQFDLLTQCEGDFESQTALSRPDYTDFIFSWAAVELIMFNTQSPLSLSDNVTSNLRKLVLNGDTTSQNDPRIQVNLQVLPSFPELPREVRTAFATAVCLSFNDTMASGSSATQLPVSSASSTGLGEVSGLNEFCQTFLQTGSGSKTIPRKSFIPLQNYSKQKRKVVAGTLCMAIESRWSKVVSNLYDYFQQMGYINAFTSSPVSPQPTAKPPITARPTAKFVATPQPTTQRPVTRKPTTKRPVTLKPTLHPVTERPTTLQPTVTSSTHVHHSASPSPTPIPQTTNPTPKPQTAKPKNKPTKRGSTPKPTVKVVTAKPTSNLGSENMVAVLVRFTTYTQDNPSKVVTAADIINGTDNGLLNSVIMALSQVIDQNTGEQVLNAYQRPVTSAVLAWDVSNSTKTLTSHRRLLDLLYSGVAYVADAPNHWINAKLPFLIHSNFTLNTSSISSSRASSITQSDDWCDDDGGSSHSFTNAAQETLGQAINDAVKGGIDDGTLLRLMKGIDSRIQGVEYLQTAELISSPPAAKVFNHILPIVGATMFAMTAMLCGGLILSARLRKIQREKDQKWRETINNEEAINKFLEMGLTYDDSLNKLMRSSMPTRGKAPERDGSLLIGNNSLCNSGPVITAETGTTAKSSLHQDTSK